MSRERAEIAAKKLACVYVDEVNLENTLTKNITLFQLLHIISPYDLDLESRWSNSKIYKTMAAPIGVKSGMKSYIWICMKSIMDRMGW